MTDQTKEPVTQQQETVTKLEKNPLRIEQGKRLVEYNHHKKEELKHLNEQITKQDCIENKPRTDRNNYVYVGDLSVFALAIGGYLLYSEFKKPERKLSHIPAPPMVKTNAEPKRDIFEMLKKFLSLNRSWLKTIRKI